MKSILMFATLLICHVSSALGASPTAIPKTIHTDLLIVGGTESGWAAAIQAARMGVESITVVHDGHWLGGQYTEQGLCCVDENKGVSKVGFGPEWHRSRMSFYRSGLFKELMDRIEAFNLAKYGAGMPGNSRHGPSTFHPAEAETIFRQMLKPYQDSGQIRLIESHYPVAATVEGVQLKSVRFAPLDHIDGESAFTVNAAMTIDASDWGDVIQLSGAAFEVGPNTQDQYGEPSASDPKKPYPPNEMNPITWAVVIEQSDVSKPIPEPDYFDDRNHWHATRYTKKAFDQLNWDRRARGGGILPWPVAGDVTRNQSSVYTMRRIVDGYKHKTGHTSILLCFALGQDYPLERLPQHVVDALEATEPGASTKNIVLMTRAQREIIFEDAKQHSLGVLYNLQTTVHDKAKDKTHSLRNFALTDQFGTLDKLPHKPYIRESLRLKAMYMMREQDGRNTDGPTRDQARESYARVMYHDGVGCWQFYYDFHNTGRAFLKEEGPAGPWVDFEKRGRTNKTVSDRSLLPLRSLIPEKIDGLIGAQKNIGYTSIVSAALRLHDQCVAIGQAAAVAAGISLKRDIQPRDIPFNATRLDEVRRVLCARLDGGQPLLLWPFRDMRTDHPSYVAVNHLAIRRAFALDRRAVDFKPDAPADPAWRQSVVDLSLATKRVDLPPTPPVGLMTRGQFAIQWWAKIKELPEIPFTRLGPTDADGDQIHDLDDPLPLNPVNLSFP